MQEAANGCFFAVLSGITDMPHRRLFPMCVAQFGKRGKYRMKKSSKWIVFLLVLVLCMAPFSVFATGGYNGLQYELIADGTEVEITGYSGSETVVTIPDLIEGHPVTSIKHSSFKGMSFITQFVIPQTVTHFGDYAFVGTAWLNEYAGDFVIVNKSLIQYKGSGAAKVVVPAGVEVIGYGAFDGSGFEEVALPEGLAAIYPDAFYNCVKLKSIWIPSTVSYIAASAFARCFSLENIGVSLENMSFASSGGVLLDKSQETLIQCPVGKTGAYSIPATVKVIGNGAFSDCVKLTAVSFPEGLLEIGDWAFSNCSLLTSVAIPGSVTKIGYWAFGESAALSHVSIASRSTFIDSMAFISLPNLKTVQVSDYVGTIGDYAFGYLYNRESQTVSRVSDFQISIDNHDDVKYTDSSIIKYALSNKFDFSFVRDVVSPILGDVSCNGKVEAEDARLALRASVGLTKFSAFAKSVGDVDKDGKMTAADARLILRASVGLTSLR